MRKAIEGQSAPVQGVGVGLEPDDEGGDEVTVTLGAQKFAPIQYHSFDVGPYVIKTVRFPGESYAGVYARVMPELRAMAQRDYEAALPEHLERVKKAAGAARGQGR